MRSVSAVLFRGLDCWALIQADPANVSSQLYVLTNTHAEQWLLYLRLHADMRNAFQDPLRANNKYNMFLTNYMWSVGMCES